MGKWRSEQIHGGEHVLLIGMMGSGKSSVGRIAAARMRRPFCDSDAAVEQRTGASIEDVFADRGEAAFRAEERAVMCAALASGVPAVIAVAGGAVMDPETRRRISDSGVVIWLEAPPHVLEARLGPGEGRPLLEGDVAGTLRRLDALRRPLYKQLSDHVVHTGSRRSQAVAEEVVRAAQRLLGTGLEDTSL